MSSVFRVQGCKLAWAACSSCSSLRALSLFPLFCCLVAVAQEVLQRQGAVCGEALHASHTHPSLSIWSTSTHLKCTLQSPYAHSFCPVFVSIAQDNTDCDQGWANSLQTGLHLTPLPSKFQIIPFMVHPRKYEGETCLGLSTGSTTQPYQG